MHFFELTELLTKLTEFTDHISGKNIDQIKKICTNSQKPQFLVWGERSSPSEEEKVDIFRQNIFIFYF